MQVNFPWGGLLRTVLAGDSLANLRRLCVPNALLKVVVGLDLERDRAELMRLEIHTLSPDYLSDALTLNYREAGFEIQRIDVRTPCVSGGPEEDPPAYAGGSDINLEPAELSKLRSSWAKRLARNPNRNFIRIVARAL